MKFFPSSRIHFLGVFYLALQTATAADLPHLRLQTWATATHIFWIRAIAPDRIAVSYFNTGDRHAPGLDVLDSSGAIVRRVWPLPVGTHCAAVYPDGTLFLLTDNWGGGFDAPAAVRPDRSVVTTDSFSRLVLFDPNAPDGRDFASRVFDPSFLSWIGGIESQPDGKVLLWGDLLLADGSFAPLIRLNPDETPDQSFHPAVAGYPRNLRIAADGAILVETINQLPPSSERREWITLNSDGTLRSSFGITVPAATSLDGAAAMLDDGSVVLSVDGGDRLQQLFPDGASGTRDGIGFWSSFWAVSKLVPFAGGQLVVLQRAACDGGGCWAQDWLRFVPVEGSNEQVATWVPPAPNYSTAPMLFVRDLQPEADYVVEGTTDFRDWQPLFGLQVQNFERSSDRTSGFVRDFEALDLRLSHRFYRTRRLN